ncbi:MAG: hypothetical protein IJ736_09480, partial [Firmicutes bacterium]|nr:hypothetical protein [Bacillota bacterium]
MLIDETVRLEVVFLPYKASMWDSLESVWKAANEDENCDAYVIPIPYYDRNHDASLKEEHYEGYDFPEEIPVTRYDNYNFEERKPDMIFIHYPYDKNNLVTTIHPYFYSDNLKKFTEELVYIPYYSTVGGMAEMQYSCSAYYNADHIVIQAPKFRKYFDKDLPDEKFIPMGSPKFDRIINLCKNQPKVPDEWGEKIKGKKVYFYNTSIGGFLANTEVFLKKMEYVFDCFKNRSDCVILWRPHPLLNATVDSMRGRYKEKYNKLKKRFIDENIGILDETADMGKSIAISDTYIGDSGTSVPSVFGIVGKPLFILNNWINKEPEYDDYKGQFITEVWVDGYTGWLSTSGNNLFKVDLYNFKFEYVCRLSEYSADGYYNMPLTIGKYTYIAGICSQDILILENDKIIKKVKLKRSTERSGVFACAVKYQQYIFLIPINYKSIVRYNTNTDEIDYLFEDKVEYFTGYVNGGLICGGFCVRDNLLFVGSPVSNFVFVLDMKSGKDHILATGDFREYGCGSIFDDGKDLWLLPINGRVVTRWNPMTGKRKEYKIDLEGLKCQDIVSGNIDQYPFGGIAFYEDYIILIPFWANMFVKLDKHTGKISEYKPPFEILDDFKNCYYLSTGRYMMICKVGDYVAKDGYYTILSEFDKVFYRINFETGDCEKIIPNMEKDILIEN